MGAQQQLLQRHTYGYTCPTLHLSHGGRRNLQNDKPQTDLSTWKEACDLPIFHYFSFMKRGQFKNNLYMLHKCRQQIVTPEKCTDMHIHHTHKCSGLIGEVLDYTILRLYSLLADSSQERIDSVQHGGETHWPPPNISFYLHMKPPLAWGELLNSAALSSWDHTFPLFFLWWWILTHSLCLSPHIWCTLILWSKFPWTTGRTKEFHEPCGNKVLEICGLIAPLKYMGLDSSARTKQNRMESA